MALFFQESFYFFLAVVVFLLFWEFLWFFAAFWLVSSSCCLCGALLLAMQGNGLSPSCFNDTCFLLQHGFDPRLWNDSTRRAFLANAHRRCPSSHCLLKDNVDVEDKTTTKNDSTKSPPTLPATVGMSMSRSPIQCGMQGSIAVSLPDQWLHCMTIDLTDRLADALGTERLYANGEEYYSTEWPIVTGVVHCNNP